MAVIENIKTLDEEQRRSLTKLYIDYCRKEITKQSSTVGFPCRVLQYLQVKRYVRAILDRIQKGELIGYASFDFEFSNFTVEYRATGFIIGTNIPGTTINNIAHFHVDNPDCYPWLVVFKELFKAYALQAKSKGARQVQITSDLQNTELTGNLESLEFYQKADRGNELDYGRII